MHFNPLLFKIHVNRTGLEKTFLQSSQFQINHLFFEKKFLNLKIDSMRNKFRTNFVRTAALLHIVFTEAPRESLRKVKKNQQKSMINSMFNSSTRLKQNGIKCSIRKVTVKESVLLQQYCHELYGCTDQVQLQDSISIRVLCSSCRKQIVWREFESGTRRLAA